jgi:hypothetical protein
MRGGSQVGYDASKVKEHMPNAANIDDVAIYVCKQTIRSSG